MKVTFLEATNGLRLSKRHSAKTGFEPYPHVKRVTSHSYDLPVSADGLKEFNQLIHEHAADGHCLLKGSLQRPIIDESRAGKTDKTASTNMLVLDFDGIKLPAIYRGSGKLTSVDVASIAQQLVAMMPVEMHNVSYIAQASASLGFKGDRVSLHLFMFLTVAMPPKAIKLWMQHINYTVDQLTDQLQLSATGQSLKYPLDPSVADNSKIIFIAPPTFAESVNNTFGTDEDRIVLVEREQPSFDLAALMNNISPQACFEKAQKIKNELRAASGFRKSQAKVKVMSVDNESYEVLVNPDQMAISVVDTTSAPYIRCNINGGDSGAYFFNLNNPVYMYNFKDEPIFEIEKADREFYKSIFDLFEEQMREQGKSEYPMVFRDFNTDTFYNGIYDPDNKSFSKLRPTSKQSIEDFMRTHGRPTPDFVPDAEIIFDPTDNGPLVQVEKMPFRVNTFKRSEYMLNNQPPAEPLEFGYAVKIKDRCPIIHKLMLHMLGDGQEELERFVNWLAHIFQTRTKTGTAWVLSGVPGTGKGVFAYEVIKPLFSEAQAPIKTLENMEEQFNSFMQTAILLVVDEFHMPSSAGQIKMANKLKAAITNKTNTIRSMRTDQHEERSFTSFIFLTNHVDAVKIEPGDRRYNIAPRQEVKLDEAHPDVIEAIPNIKNELSAFAGYLQTFKVNERMVQTPIINDAKSLMQNVSLSVFEEFCQAARTGNLNYFVDVLEINVTNVMHSGEITTAQRFVKEWIANAYVNLYSVIPAEHLRMVYHVLTEQTPRLSTTEFKKRLARNNLKIERKRLATASRNDNPIRGLVVTWSADKEELETLTDSYFDANDKMLLQAV